MSPRPRQATDEDMLRAAFRAICRLGPARLTLADVARETGVTAAAVAQRFGSKRALLLAAASDAAGGCDYIFPALRARYTSPLAALLGMAECMTLMGSTPQAVANTIAFMNAGLTDPDFHRHSIAGSNGMQAGLRALVKDAIKARELRRCDAGRLARALHATINGSLVNWAVHRNGDLASWIRRDLETVLYPYRVSGRPRPEGRARGRRRGTINRRA